MFNRLYTIYRVSHSYLQLWFLKSTKQKAKSGMVEYFSTLITKQVKENLKHYFLSALVTLFGFGERSKYKIGGDFETPTIKLK